MTDSIEAWANHVLEMAAQSKAAGMAHLTDIEIIDIESERVVIAEDVSFSKDELANRAVGNLEGEL